MREKVDENGSESTAAAMCWCDRRGVVRPLVLGIAAGRAECEVENGSIRVGRSVCSEWSGRSWYGSRSTSESSDDGRAERE